MRRRPPGRSGSPSPTPTSSRGDVDYVNAHGTSTELNDRSETQALQHGARRARRERADLVDQVGDRPPARRGGRGRGDRDDRRARARGRAADPEPDRARGGSRPRLRAARGAPARLGERRRRTPDRRSPTRSASADTTRSSAWRRDQRARPAREVAAPAGAAARLERLCDPGTVPADPQRGAAASRRRPRRARRATAWSRASARSAGRPVACYSQDPSFMGGSLGSVHADTICPAARARRARRRSRSSASSSPAAPACRRATTR